MSNTRFQTAVRMSQRSAGAAVRAPRISDVQAHYLADYMLAHRDFAAGRFESGKASQTRENGWTVLTDSLNGMGPSKTAVMWKKVWKDMKHRVRQRLNEINKGQKKTGNTSKPPKPLNDLEAKVAGLLGSAYLMGNNVQEPLPNDLEDRDEKPVLSPLLLSPCCRGGSPSQSRPSPASGWSGSAGEGIAGSAHSTDSKKAKKSKNELERKEAIDAAWNASREDDEFDGIGLNVACKLRRMGEQQRLYAEMLINKVLLSGVTGRLLEETDLCNLKFLRPRTPLT